MITVIDYNPGFFVAGLFLGWLSYFIFQMLANMITTAEKARAKYMRSLSQKEKLKYLTYLRNR